MFDHIKYDALDKFSCIVFLTKRTSRKCLPGSFDKRFSCRLPECVILVLLIENVFLKVSQGLSTHNREFLNISFEPVHEISNNMACATSKASDQPVH